MNKRGRLVVERLAWARAVVPDEAPPDWLSAGDEIAGALRAAMHGEVDPRSLDESYVRLWQQTGLVLEVNAVAGGRQSINHWLAHSAAVPPKAGAQRPDVRRAQGQEIRAELCRRAGVDPGAEEPEDLLSVVSMAEVGAGILLRLAEDEGLFPASDAEAKRVGMRLLSSTLGDPSSADASIFLTHALATYMGLFFIRASAEGQDVPEGVGEFYVAIRDRVLSHVFPLSGVDQMRLQQCAHVYRAFDGLSTSDIPPEVPGYPTTPGPMGVTAIELHGDDPANSPEDTQSLLEGTRISAEWHFLLEAFKHAVHIAVGTEAYRAIAEGMTHDSGIPRLGLSLYFKQAWVDAFGPFRDLATRWSFEDAPSAQALPTSSDDVSSKSLTDQIIELGCASKERVNEAISEAYSRKLTPAQMLLEQGAISTEDVVRASELLGFDHLDLGRLEIDPGALNLIPRQAAKRYEAIPVAFIGDDTLVVATSDPTNVRAVDEISIMTGLDVQLAVASRDEITTVISSSAAWLDGGEHEETAGNDSDCAEVGSQEDDTRNRYPSGRLLPEPSHRGISSKTVAQHIVELGYASQDRVDAAIAKAHAQGFTAEQLLREEGEINRDQLGRAIAERSGLDHLDLKTFEVDPRAVELVPDGVAKRVRAVPVAFVEDGSLLLAMADPADVRAVDDIACMTGRCVWPVVASEESIAAVISAGGRPVSG